MAWEKLNGWVGSWLYALLFLIVLETAFVAAFGATLGVAGAPFVAAVGAAKFMVVVTIPTALGAALKRLVAAKAALVALVIIIIAHFLSSLDGEQPK